MAKHWRILSLSLLALIGVLAVNASAAQAKWLLLKEVGGKVESVLLLNLTGLSSETGYLLTANGNKIRCTGSTGTAHVELSADHKTMNAEATVKFTGCTEEQFPTTCSVHSEGQPNGTIVASGKGVAGMTGEEVYVEAQSKEFTRILQLGEECPLNESNEAVSGKVKIIVLEPLVLKELHEIHIKGEELKLENTSATLHMLDKEGKPLELLLGHIVEATGAPIAVHLCELPGAPTCP